MEPPSVDVTGLSTWQLVATSATPTVIVCILGAVGAILAHKGVLNAQGCQTVAQLNFYVFTPALTFSFLAQAVNPRSVAHLWPLLANMTVSVIMGMGLGFLLARLTRTPPEYRSIVMCAVAFSNVGNLPLVFVSTLCHDRQAVFYRSLGDECEHRGVAYTAFDIAAATLWQFTLAIGLIRRAAARTAQAGANPELGPGAEPAAEPALAGTRPNDNGGLPVRTQPPLRKEPTLSDLLRGRPGSYSGSASSSPREEQPQQAQQAQQAQQQPEGDHHGHPLPLPWQRPGGPAIAPTQPQPPPHAPASPFQPALNGASSHGLHARTVVELQPAVAFQPHPLSSQPLPLGWSPGRAHPASSERADEAEDKDTAALLGSAGKRHGGRGGGGPAAGAGSLPARWVRSVWQYARAVDWGAAFPLPSQAALLGIAVGCLPPVKALLFSPQPPLRVLTEALDTLRAGLLPTAIPLLGAILCRGPGASRLPRRVTAAVLVARLLVQPALSTALILAALRLRLFVSPDPMFLLILLLSNATPTALNMQTMTVLYHVGEGEMAAMLFWQYIASVLTLPACMWVFLRIIDTWQ